MGKVNNYVINMPQMAVEALSENWLFKEIGGFHWDLICEGLETKSFDIKNDTANRLYATFVRIRIVSEINLKAFKENETASLTGAMSRYGNSMYFSDLEFSAKDKIVKAELMTTFSIRDDVDNTKLAKSEPSSGVNKVPVLKKFPLFGNQYRLAKKRILKELEYKDYKFSISYDEEPLGSVPYALNPFYDINGVNLLYFAAYPIINDICEGRYMNEHGKSDIKFAMWEDDFSTCYKDVFYYANCNLSDSLSYELLELKVLDTNTVQLSSNLKRNSDGAIIAKIFSVKTRK